MNTLRRARSSPPISYAPQPQFTHPPTRAHAGPFPLASAQPALHPIPTAHPLHLPFPRQVKPVLLDLFERHFVTLGAAVVPCLPGLVLALLTAMEDVGSE